VKQIGDCLKVQCKENHRIDIGRLSCRIICLYIILSSNASILKPSSSNLSDEDDNYNDSLITSPNSWKAERDSNLSETEIFERNKRFDEMKKRHYHAMANPLRNSLKNDEIEDEKTEEKQNQINN